MINIGKKRECFFDDYLIDTVRTTANTKVHHPVRREAVFVMDKPWEERGDTFFNFFYDTEYGKYRMYYLTRGSFENAKICACYAESKDFKTWEKPNLGICSFGEYTETNILTDKDIWPRLDNFMVFKDENPDCPKDEKYKAILRKVLRGDPKEVHCDFGLMYLASEDGIHFREMYPIHEHGAYDSLNTAFWDSEAKLYRAYFRWNHKPGDKSSNMKMGLGVRDIRYIESKDFKTWTEPKMLDYGECEDIPLYTNLVQPYYRAPQIIIGMPSRYIQRTKWTKSFDELCGKENRLMRMVDEDRFGLAITDLVFMASRNGVNFKRYDEALMPPLPENEEGWVYGDCYATRGIYETPSDIEGADPEMSIMCQEGRRFKRGNYDDRKLKAYRYSLRCDGFVSRHAGATEKMLVTKPFVFDGKDMYANIATSARGYMYFTLKSKDGEVIESCEMFGNSIDKKIGFEDGAVENLSGKEVVLEVRMLDADIYAIRFE